MTQRRVRLLDVDKIVDTAIVLINEKGRFTMPELATRLGVSVSSIYHHISGRGELVDRIRERVSAPVQAADFDVHDWEQAVVTWLTSFREAFARHPELVPLPSDAPASSPSSGFGHQRLELALGNAGFPPGQVPLWISVLDCYGVGAALDLASELADGRHTRHTRRGREQVDEAFELGVRAVVDGMRSALSGHSAGV